MSREPAGCSATGPVRASSTSRRGPVRKRPTPIPGKSRAPTPNDAKGRIFHDSVQSLGPECHEAGSHARSFHHHFTSPEGRARIAADHTHQSEAVETRHHHISLACGLAVGTGQPVITPDVFGEPRWWK